MARCTYINGSYLPTNEAMVNVEDRGYMFADGVYEAIAVHNGVIVDFEPHIERMKRSLSELEIALPVSINALRHIVKEVIRRNMLGNGSIYLQITRGVAPRNHLFPDKMKSSLLVTMYNIKGPSEEKIKNGVKTIARRDIRWKRCDIKSLALLPNTMLKREAFKNGAHETIMFDDNGYVTEGTSTSVWIVNQKGELVARPLGDAILGGVVRQAIVNLSMKNGINIVERIFTIEELKEAKEIFLSGTSSNIIPVVKVDDVQIADRKPGAITKRLIELYMRAKLSGGGCA
ncbi:MAG: D-amino-acid transaminase [Alphaproteobacteria bacterium]|nr:D-amino-acid transaminase [Alphaproteobacteria bacterium]